MIKIHTNLLILALTVSFLVACGIDADVHDAVVAEKEAAQDSVAQLEQENNKIRDDLTGAEANLQNSQKRLERLMAVHPPRRFKDRTEIETWLRNDDISERQDSSTAEAWLSAALEQQARALEDGYIVSADFVSQGDGQFTVWVSAVAENLDYYSWDVEKDEVVFGANINQLPVE